MESYPNLDCMTTDQLDDLLRYIQTTPHKEVAAELFPGHVDLESQNVLEAAIVQVERYAWNTVTARGQRLIGEVATAMLYEDRAEFVYNQLPEWARW